jgi:hypothetical protein
LSGNGNGVGWTAGVSPACGPRIKSGEEASGPKHTANTRTGLVLDLLLAEIVQGDVEAVAHLLVRRGAEANPARLRQRFKPGCNVDAVAEDVAILDDVAEIDAHAKFDAPLCRCPGVAGDHLPLQLDRTAHRIDDAGKLRKEAVAVVLTIRPRGSAILGSPSSRRTARSAASVPSSSAPISRE